MKKIANILWFSILLVCLNVQSISATSYKFLREAIREHKENPSPETEAKLKSATFKAKILDSVWWSIPTLIVLYVGVRIVQSRKAAKKSEK